MNGDQDSVCFPEETPSGTGNGADFGAFQEPSSCLTVSASPGRHLERVDYH